MGHGPLINQTYEVIRGPTEAKASVSEGTATRGVSQHVKTPGGTNGVKCLSTRFEEPKGEY